MAQLHRNGWHKPNRNIHKSISIILAIITVLGGAVVALINNWDKIIGVPTPEVNISPKPTEPILKDLKIVSFCDAVKGLNQDAHNDFNNVRRKIISSDSDQDVWESIYQVKNIPIEIVLDKDDATTEADIYIYQGNESELAIKSFNTYIVILDACLNLIKGELNEGREPSENRPNKYYWIEYRGEDYGVEIWLSISRDEAFESSTSISILKKGKI